MGIMAQYLPVACVLVSSYNMSFCLLSSVCVCEQKVSSICLLLIIMVLYDAGTPAMTTRGCLEDDFEVIADFLIRATQIAGSVLKQHGKVQKEFLRGLENNKDIIELGNLVEAFASQFAMPGFDV